MTDWGTPGTGWGLTFLAPNINTNSGFPKWRRSRRRGVNFITWRLHHVSVSSQNTNNRNLAINRTINNCTGFFEYELEQWNKVLSHSTLIRSGGLSLRARIKIIMICGVCLQRCLHWGEALVGPSSSFSGVDSNVIVYWGKVIIKCSFGESMSNEEEL